MDELTIKPDISQRQPGEKILARIRKIFEVKFETLDVDGLPLEVLGISNMETYIDSLLAQKKIRNPLRDLPLWAKIWPAAFILGRFLRRFDATGKSLLEVGAGMGVCGLIAARYGFSRLALTDVDEMALDFARANVVQNNLQDKIDVRRLDLCAMGDASLDSAYDYIAASELLYLDNLHRPLIKLLERRLAPQGKALFCTDMARLKPHFKKLASKMSFKIQEGHIGVKSREEDGSEQRRIYNILILEKA